MVSVVLALGLVVDDRSELRRRVAERCFEQAVLCEGGMSLPLVVYDLMFSGVCDCGVENVKGAGDGLRAVVLVVRHERCAVEEDQDRAATVSSSRPVALSSELCVRVLAFRLTLTTNFPSRQVDRHRNFRGRKFRVKVDRTRPYHFTIYGG